LNDQSEERKSDKYKHRIDPHEVIPIVSTNVPQSAFDPTAKIGGRRFDPDDAPRRGVPEERQQSTPVFETPRLGTGRGKIGI
jgi:hypothetical protein